MEFWSALLGAVIGGGASWAAAVYTLRRTADHAETAWRRDKRAKALEDFDLLTAVALEAAMSGGGDGEHLAEAVTATLMSPEWTKASRSVIVYVPHLHQEVQAVTDAFWHYADEDPTDEIALHHAMSRFQAGMQRELGLPSILDVTQRRQLP